ncbi:bacteriophage protein [Burkholderia multivorans ATCC 17616]|uniref:Bacteriophage protein n=1 Tax=Burkholderia multivorans (strain ATCC 17616 / 249) TaxID=395019 RepID=A0A0H3KNA1_BURM1|nr:gp35 [Burkholderia phage Bcep176]ABA60036.1 gp35 [Burkholderia phage Bcep176]BAG46523.1 bacteriophage protein [Burkholderia multivorans ATCC 17616]
MFRLDVLFVIALLIVVYIIAASGSGTC